MGMRLVQRISRAGSHVLVSKTWHTRTNKASSCCEFWCKHLSQITEIEWCTCFFS